MATKAQCERALEVFGDELSARRNVVGLGILPIHDQGGTSNNLAVAIYVKKKIPKDKLAGKDVVPEVLEIKIRSGKRKKVPTRVIEQGEVELE